jgi:hypothetical protein
MVGWTGNPVIVEAVSWMVSVASTTERRGAAWTEASECRTVLQEPQPLPLAVVACRVVVADLAVAVRQSGMTRTSTAARRMTKVEAHRGRTTTAAVAVGAAAAAGAAVAAAVVVRVATVENRTTNLLRTVVARMKEVAAEARVVVVCMPAVHVRAATTTSLEAVAGVLISLGANKTKDRVRERYFSFF